MGKLIVSLAQFSENKNLDEIPLYKLKLDSGTRQIKNAIPGLLIWPYVFFKGFHLHYYKDSKDGKIKAHLKDEQTKIKISYNPSFRKFNRYIIDKFRFFWAKF